MSSFRDKWVLGQIKFMAAGGKALAWSFIVGGIAIDLMLGIGLVYSVAHRNWQPAVEFAIGLALFAATPWLGYRMLRDAGESS